MQHTKISEMLFAFGAQQYTCIVYSAENRKALRSLSPAWNREAGSQSGPFADIPGGGSRAVKRTANPVSRKGKSVSEAGRLALANPEKSMMKVIEWKTTFLQTPPPLKGVLDAGAHVWTSCSITRAEMYKGTHGRRAW